MARKQLFCPVCQAELQEPLPPLCPTPGCGWDLENDLTLSYFLGDIPEEMFQKYKQRLQIAKKNWNDRLETQRRQQEKEEEIKRLEEEKRRAEEHLEKLKVAKNESLSLEKPSKTTPDDTVPKIRQANKRLILGGLFLVILILVAIVVIAKGILGPKEQVQQVAKEQHPGQVTPPVATPQPTPMADLKTLVEKELARNGFDGLTVQDLGDRVVSVSGTVHNPEAVANIESIVRGVPGVQKIVRKLTVDMIKPVKNELARNGFDGLQVRDLGKGTISVSGSVRKPEDHKDIQAIVAKVPGVKTVKLNLRAPEQKTVKLPEKNKPFSPGQKPSELPKRPSQSTPQTPEPLYPPKEEGLDKIFNPDKSKLERELAQQGLPDVKVRADGPRSLILSGYVRNYQEQDLLRKIIYGRFNNTQISFASVEVKDKTRDPGWKPYNPR